MISDEIDAWVPLLLSTGNNKKVVEAAFLSIAVVVEKYLAEQFNKLASDPTTALNELRSIKIDSKELLTQLIKGDNSQFVDYTKAIQRCSQIIFDTNPFSLIYNDADLAPILEETKAIRNFLAHRSDEARDRYIRRVLSNGNFVDVADFLLAKRNNTQISNYDRIAEKLKNIEEIFSDDARLLALTMAQG